MIYTGIIRLYYSNMDGFKRNIFRKSIEILNLFPCLVILGVRQCGKTTLAEMCRPDWLYIDLENPDDFDRVTRDPAFFFKTNPQNIIIDEAQVYPEIFAVLRGVIDKDRAQNNRFILTGSSSPELLKAVSESLAGRVGLVELDTFKGNEIYQRPLGGFYEIFKTKLTKKNLTYLKTIDPVLTHSELMTVFMRGGYPEPVLAKNEKKYKLWMENYFRTYIERDVRRLFPKLDATKYRRFISMLSSLSGTIINRSELGRSINVSEAAIRDYLDIATGTFLWRNYLSYEKSLSKSVVKMSRGGFRDTGLLHYLQKITDLQMLDQSPYVGRFFENFICEEILKGLSALSIFNWDYRYYRTKHGFEIDLILDGEFGILPIEIKYGMKTSARNLRSIDSFVKDHKLPYGILINNADRIELLTENVIQIPATYL